VPGTETSLESRIQELEAQLAVLTYRIEARVEKSVEEKWQLRLSHLEQKQEALAQRVAKTEGAISVLGQRSAASTPRQSYQYHPPVRELQAYTGENLAKRLGVDQATLERERQNQSVQDFERWCRSKDPGSLGWRFGDNGLYHPIKLGLTHCTNRPSCV